MEIKQHNKRTRDDDDDALCNKKHYPKALSYILAKCYIIILLSAFGNLHRLIVL